MKKGEEASEHIHEDSDDIVYPLSGKARGYGEFIIQKGVAIRIPKKIKQRMYDVEEDLVFYDVFEPPIM